MSVRLILSLATCTVALSLAGSLSAQQSSAPFTIQRPPDGSTVREKVSIQIPRASMKPGSFIAFYVDDKFHTAVAPDDNPTKPFAYVWDTKGAGIGEGEHTIRAVLFEPAPGSGGDGLQVVEKATSEVKLNVANRIKGGPATLRLRYNYREGQNLEYGRESSTKSYTGDEKIDKVASERELDSVRAKLLLDIQDSRPSEDLALVRNKLTALSVLFNGQETRYDPLQLSGSMYQELNGQGRVVYETGTAVGLAEFLAQGLPVNNTLQLPVLPLTPVTVGQTWKTPGQRVEIPGIPPALQPRVTMNNKFEGLEWEGGYQTAKIVQTPEKEITRPELTYSGINILSPKMQFERTLYIAYKSGTLVKTVNKLTIVGRTTDVAPSTSLGGGGGMGGMRPGGMGGSSMPPGMGGSGMMGAMPPGMGGSSGPPSGMMAGIMGAMRGGRGGGGSSMPPGMMSGMRPGGRQGGSGGMMGAMPPGMGGGGSSGMAGMMGAMMRGRQGGGGSSMPPGMGGSGMMGGMMSGMRPGGRQGGMGMGGLGGGAVNMPDPETPITLKSETTTQLLAVKSR